MNKIAEFVLLFLGILFLLLGAVFLMAAGEDPENLGIGLFLVLLAFGIFFLIYWRKPFLETLLASRRPQGNPGHFTKKQLSCPGCGAPIPKENVEISRGGFMVSCTFCSRSSFLQEEPKW